MSDGSEISAAQHKRNSISPSPLTPQSNYRSSAPTSLHERHINRNSYFTSVSQSAQSVCPITTNIHNQNKLYESPLFPHRQLLKLPVPLPASLSSHHSQPPHPTSFSYKIVDKWTIVSPWVALWIQHPSFGWRKLSTRRSTGVRCNSLRIGRGSRRWSHLRNVCQRERAKSAIR